MGLVAFAAKQKSRLIATWRCRRTAPSGLHTGAESCECSHPSGRAGRRRDKQAPDVGDSVTASTLRREQSALEDAARRDHYCTLRMATRNPLLPDSTLPLPLSRYSVSMPVVVPESRKNEADVPGTA